ncbi:hypothetical protein ACI78R_18090 [Geodermatophilus sp. SYSU D01106]
MVAGLALWILLAVVLGVVVGKGIRLADRPSDLSGRRRVSVGVGSAAAQAGARAVLSPLGIGLALVVIVLHAAAFVSDLGGAAGPSADVLSTDAARPLPRLFAAGLLAAAALAAVAGAARNRLRRAWWLTVGLVAAGAVAVQLGGPAVVADATSPSRVLVIGTLVAVGTLALLALVSRGERRDRRRVLAAVALYALAHGGWSVAAAVGSGVWATSAASVAASVSGLAAVAVLLTVLVGVAPGLVLPAARLRRDDDALSLETPVRDLPAVQD